MTRKEIALYSLGMVAAAGALFAAAICVGGSKPTTDGMLQTAGEVIGGVATFVAAVIAWRMLNAQADRDAQRRREDEATTLNAIGHEILALGEDLRENITTLRAMHEEACNVTPGFLSDRLREFADFRSGNPLSFMESQSEVLRILTAEEISQVFAFRLTITRYAGTLRNTASMISLCLDSFDGREAAQRMVHRLAATAKTTADEADDLYFLLHKRALAHERSEERPPLQTKAQVTTT
jgi:hypothetical protein